MLTYCRLPSENEKMQPRVKEATGTARVKSNDLC